MTEQPRVTYDVKELLERMDRRLERIDEKLDSKADAIVVVALEQRMSSLTERFNVTEARARETERKERQTFSRREKAVMASLAAFSLGFNVLVTLTGGGVRL